MYRSGARANQTDIIDLTCDLEIRKITDGERLEPIIIVNIGRPVSRFLAATPPRRCGPGLSPSSPGQLYRPNLATMQPTTLASFSAFPPHAPLPWPIFSDICVFLRSLHRRLPPFSTPFALSIFGYLSPVRPVSRAFIYINFGGLFAFRWFRSSGGNIK